MIASSYGQEYSFWLAAAVTGAHAVVLLVLLPETRGKSLAEIQRLLADAASSADKSAAAARLLVPELQKVQIVPAAATVAPHDQGKVGGDRWIGEMVDGLFC